MRWRVTPLGQRVRAATTGLVVLQIIAVVVFGSITITHYPLWSAVDEGAHFDNVIYVADHGTYPVLGKTFSSNQQLAIRQGIYPKHTTINARTDGLGGLAYEAFQPPLYYYVAAPISMLSGNYHSKAILLRFFGLFLLLVAIGLLARLSRHVLKQRWLLGLAGGMLVLLMPGVVVRMVTISNGNLAIPLAILTVTELWIAWEQKSSRRLVGCGVLVACGVLTDLYLAELIPVFGLVAVAILWQKRTRSDVVFASVGAAAALVVVLPWLIFNEAKYHALTASAIAKKEQLSTVNPEHIHFTVAQVPGLTVQNLFQPLMPQEFGGFLVNHNLFMYASTLFQVLIIPLAIVLAIAMWRRMVTTGYWILVLPFVFNVLLCWYIDLGQQWESGSMVGRYTYATLAPIALFSVAAIFTLFRQSVRPVLITVAISSIFLVVLWIHLVPSIRSV